GPELGLVLEPVDTVRGVEILAAADQAHRLVDVAYGMAQLAGDELLEILAQGFVAYRVVDDAVFLVRRAHIVPGLADLERFVRVLERELEVAEGLKAYQLVDRFFLGVGVVEKRHLFDVEDEL